MNPKQLETLLLEAGCLRDTIERFTAISPDVVDVISIGRYFILKIDAGWPRGHMYVSSRFDPNIWFDDITRALHHEIAGRHADLLDDLHKLFIGDDK